MLQGVRGADVGKLRAANGVAQWHVLDGTGRSRAAQGLARSAAPQRARHSLCNEHTREGVQLFRPRRAHRAMRELLCLPSALDAPRYGQLTRSVTRQACDKPAPLASAKSAVTAPIPATVPPPPGVDNDLPYLSLRTGGRSGRDGSRWPFHGRATPAIMAGTRHLVLVHGRSMTPPEPDCPSGRCWQPPGSDAIQGVVSGGLIASWCRT